MRTGFRWDEPGKLLSATPFVNGIQHGVARQWDDRGRIVGTYKMVRGTGIDLWWRWRARDKSPYLAETLFWKNGHVHGFEWWINEDQRSVYIERHWWRSKLHGIHREWVWGKGLDRGFPKFYLQNKKVGKREYLNACKTDPTLPPYRPKGDRPRRDFPEDVARHLRLKVRRSGAALGA